MTLKEYIEKQKLSKIKIHVGCGGMRWQDYINVDLHPYSLSVHDRSRSGCVADVYADMRSLGLADNSIDEVFTSHTIDHFNRWVALDMLTDWYRMFKPGGTLIIEVADFVRCILWLFHPLKKKRKLALDQFYGNQWDKIDFQTHRYLWSARELKTELMKIGYNNVHYNHLTLTHHPGRDMRMVAFK